MDTGAAAPWPRAGRLPLCKELCAVKCQPEDIHDDSVGPGVRAIKITLGEAPRVPICHEQEETGACHQVTLCRNSSLWGLPQSLTPLLACTNLPNSHMPCSNSFLRCSKTITRREPKQVTQRGEEIFARCATRQSTTGTLTSAHQRGSSMSAAEQTLYGPSTAVLASSQKNHMLQLLKKPECIAVPHN